MCKCGAPGTSLLCGWYPVWIVTRVCQWWLAYDLVGGRRVDPEVHPRCSSWLLCVRVSAFPVRLSARVLI